MTVRGKKGVKSNQYDPNIIVGYLRNTIEVTNSYKNAFKLI